jgi:hypothetical protein
VQQLLQWKAIIITYSEDLSVALSIPHATRMRHIVSCDLPGSTVFVHIISQTARLSKKKNNIEYEMCFLIFSTTFVWNISHSKKNAARYDQECTSRKALDVLDRFQRDWNFLDRFSKNG